MGPSHIAYLQLLPAEIWLACWTLCSTRQVRRLSLVCQLFRSLCIPLLFQQQSVDATALIQNILRSNWIDRLRHLHRIAVRLERIADGPHVLMVRSFKFSARASVPATHRIILNFYLFHNNYQRVLTTIPMTLGRYQQLRSLEIREFSIDKSFRDTLMSLSQLEDLALHRCEITARDGVLLNLNSFAIFDDQTGLWSHPSRVLGVPLQIASPESLRTLNIHAQLEASALITGFGPANLSHLVDLTLGPLLDLDILFGLLKKCPRLESLAVPSMLYNTHTSLPESMHPDAIPQLRNITAPLDLIQLLVPNRPIQAVTVVGEEDPDDPCLEELMCALSRSSAPLLSLAIPIGSPTVDFLGSIAPLFPQLQRLSLDFADDIDIGCGFICGREPTSAVDTRSPALCDEEAFDDLPDEDVSDAEDDEPRTYRVVDASTCLDIPTSSRLHMTLNWICAGVVALPPRIEVLKLVDDSITHSRLSLELQRQVVARLSFRYPVLREVEMLGFRQYTWERTEASWACKQWGAESRIQVHS
ncbi:hypothetical protein C8R44DRAFT_817734 [Mycena epipterygia]|nr:hypothetical protein C8R44DRAFT_817734 [Mycena epipterygia]